MSWAAARDEASRSNFIPLVDEEEGDQEAEADRGQLRFEDRELAAAQRGPDDHPGDEAAEQQVEAELGGQGDQTEDEHDRDPHCELAARLQRALELRPKPRHASRTETSARASAMAMNASRIAASCSGWVVERTSVTSRIGPNSPAAPAASR